MKNRTLTAAAFLAYLACIPAANWLVTHIQPVTVAPGIKAPAGVLLAGAAFTLRDLVQRSSGKTLALIAVAAGCVLSLTLAPGALALASGCAFLASETLDMAAFTPLERRSYLGAVAVSNTLGAVVDSVVFLGLAFGSMQYLPGQIVGKMEMTAVAVALIAAAGKTQARR